MLSLQQLKALHKIYQRDMSELARRIICSAFPVHQLKLLETGTPWRDDGAYLAWMQDPLIGAAYFVSTESFSLYGEKEQRWGYSICRCRDRNQSADEREDRIIWRVVNPLTLTAYPMHAVPKIEFPREDEYCPAVPRSIIDPPCGKADYFVLERIA